ncbi:MAG: polysaccharide deacetylase family protein [Spirulinaceae cyanobacterium]
MNSRVIRRRKKFLTILAVSSFALGIFIPLQRATHQGESTGSIFTSLTNIFSSREAKPKNVAAPSNQLFGEMAEGLYSKQEAEYIKNITFTIPERFKGKTINDVPVPQERKVVALTFDDGPWEETTNDTLFILDKYGIKATFFVVGQYIQAYPEIIKKVVRHGHALGNHTWSHGYHGFSEAAAAKELDNTAAAIEKLTGAKTSLFRPPGGILTNGLVSYAHKKGYVNVMWSADSHDYRSSSAVITKKVLSQTKPGGVILLHDGGGNRQNTVNALPKIIESLIEQGYSFVTLPELLEISDQASKEAEKPKPKAVQQ